jgi:hypothetical protein
MYLMRNVHRIFLFQVGLGLGGLFLLFAIGGLTGLTILGFILVGSGLRGLLGFFFRFSGCFIRDSRCTSLFCKCICSLSIIFRELQTKNLLARVFEGCTDLIGARYELLETQQEG